jgi:hypothetical protein
MSLYLPLHKNLHRQYAFEHIPSKVTSESLHLDPKKKSMPKQAAAFLSWTFMRSFSHPPYTVMFVRSFLCMEK